jgi:hypothetical protein
VFETTIRVLGGLLSAYALSSDGLFIDRATELANNMVRPPARLRVRGPCSHATDADSRL